jgi:hypothetical protein
MTYNKITIVAQILLQNTLIKHENINVFEGNQGYFHPFIDPERGGVVPFQRDLNEGKGLGD